MEFLFHNDMKIRNIPQKICLFHVIIEKQRKNDKSRLSKSNSEISSRSSFIHKIYTKVSNKTKPTKLGDIIAMEF